MPTPLICFGVYAKTRHVATAMYSPDGQLSPMECLRQLTRNLEPGVYTITSTLYISKENAHDIVTKTHSDFVTAFGYPVFGIVEGTVTIS